MRVDSTFIDYYRMNMSSSRKYEDADVFYKMFGCKTKKELDSKINLLNVTIIGKIVESGLTLEEYCAIYGGSVNKLERLAYRIRLQNPDLYNEFRKNCCKKPCEEFYIYIRSIVDEMLLKGNSFDIFDYYYLIKLNPRLFQGICEKILDFEEQKLISPILSRLKHFSYYEYIDIDVELSGTIIIKDYELSNDEKTKIVKYLIHHNMPMEALRPAFRKYVNGDERLTSYVNQNQKFMK